VRSFRTGEERDRADALASRLGTYIPGDISYGMWPLPILEAIVDRLDAMQAEQAQPDRRAPVDC
jgi:hypothetical protein